MTPARDLIEKLRLLLNDKDKKSFTDEELNLFLEEADCIYCAASQGWVLKSLQYENTVGEMYEYKVGQETYKSSSIKDLVSVAYQNADKFKDMCTNKKEKGSFMLGISTEFEI